MKNFLIYALSLCAILSCLQEERSPEEILVPSPAQVDCSESSFMLTSKVPEGSEKLVDECGFYVGKDKSLADAAKVTGTMTSNTFSASLPTRDYGTTYHICSFVTNGRELEFKSDVMTFELKPLEEYVNFGGVDILAYDKASRRVEITIDTEVSDGVDVSEVGVCYGEDKTSLTVEDAHKTGLWSAASTRITLDGFDDATQYYLKPYIKDGDYLAYGEVLPFYIPTTPIVNTFNPADVSTTKAEFAGEVVSDGGSEIMERGFVWTEGRTISTTESHKIIIDGTVGQMTYVAELSPNREYTYCAYAVNSFGTAYGEPITLKTKIAAPEVSSTVVSSVTSTTAVFSSTVTYHGGQTVSEVGFYYSTDESLDPETSFKINQTYSADEFSMTASDLIPNSRYYVKAYAVNNAGVAYGEVKSFMTASSVPSVVTVGATEITSTGALLSGMIVSENGEAVTEKGFLWILGDGIPTIESHKLKADGSGADFSAKLDNLEQNQKYSFRAYATNAKGTSYGDILIFSTSAGLPSLSSIDIADITATSATFSSTVTGHGGSTVSEVGFYYSTSPEVDPETSKKVSQLYAKDAFTLSVSDLLIYQKYYVRAYAVNSAGQAYSPVVSFTTLSSKPVVTTAEATDITPAGATLNGEVLTDNGATISERGFVWVEGTGTPTSSSGKLIASGTTGVFSAVLTDLTPNKKYSYRAYAVNSNGTSYGETKEFTTITDRMQLHTGEATVVTPVSATISGSITYYGGNDVTECGVCWSTGNDPATSDSHKASAHIDDNFTVDLSGLNENTTYYARAYATAESGETYYGNTITFTTPYIVVLPSSSKVTVTNINVSSATFSANVISNGHGTILDAGFVYSTTSGPTLQDNKVSCGAKTGSFSAQITELKEGTTYYVRSYVTNNAGTAYGEEVSFTTESIKLPSLSKVTVSDITYNSAAFSAQVIALNNGTLEDAGFVYSTYPDPYVNSTKISCGNVTDLQAPSVPLRASTTYYVRAYAENEKGIAYGEQTTFTTEVSPGQSDVDADDFTPEEDWD